jgi:hypothetical protein
MNVECLTKVKFVILILLQKFFRIKLRLFFFSEFEDIFIVEIMHYSYVYSILVSLRTFYCRNYAL